MAHAEYFYAQQRLQQIFTNCQDWNRDQLDRAIDGLLGSTNRMVRVKTQMVRTSVSVVSVVQNGSISSISDSESDSESQVVQPVLTLSRPSVFPHISGPITPSGPPPPLRVPPPVARVMPNQTGGLTLPRPSVLLQQMRASLVTSADTLARVEVETSNTRWNALMMGYITKRAVGEARFNANCQEPCAICLETHTTGDSMVTKECNHCFGKQCWKTWMSNPNGNQTCPECRKHLPHAIWYTLRKSQKK